MQHQEVSENQIKSLIVKDEDLAKRFHETKVAVSNSKNSLTSHAQSFLSKYKSEISEGDRKKQLLLEEGKRSGKTAEEALAGHGFIPSSSTPIMNFLYFSDRDKDYDNNPTVLLEEGDLGKDLEELREHYDLKYGHLNESYSDEAARPGAAPAMEEFIYQNITHETFKKLKKLKSLSKSPNEAEAFQAYRKCNELCKKYNLDFDRIPS